MKEGEAFVFIFRTIKTFFFFKGRIDILLSIQREEIWRTEPCHPLKEI